MFPAKIAYDAVPFGIPLNAKKDAVRATDAVLEFEDETAVEAVSAVATSSANNAYEVVKFVGPEKNEAVRANEAVPLSAPPGVY